MLIPNTTARLRAGAGYGVMPGLLLGVVANSRVRETDEGSAQG